MSKDFTYWKQQIESAKDAHKKYFDDAKTCIKEYTAKDKNYNIFYSNVQTLDSNLCLANPKADIQRRFLKNLEYNKVKSEAYSQVAKIMCAAVDYCADVGNLDYVMKQDTHNTDVVGRGIAWVEYNPTITTLEDGTESVSSRDITIEPLKYDEFLCSSAEKKSDIWWVARRHLLTRNDIKSRFGYSADDSELQYKPYGKDDETILMRGEVWEIWDKNDKTRSFILMTHKQHELLEQTEDPYKLECFFPCDTLEFLSEENSVIPVSEYMIYRKQAEILEVISKKIAQTEDQIKYIIVNGSQDKGIAEDINKAKHCTAITIPSTDAQGGVNSMIGFVPTDPAIKLLEHLESQKERTKANIYDITGISDLMRGMSDSRETATAQMIKGVFGSLRFQDRQKKVQLHRRNIYRIIAEIIAEHYDMETLATMTGTILPMSGEKEQLSEQINMDKINGMQPSQDVVLKYQQIVDLPTWDDVIGIMRSDRLRNYTVEVETAATAFDDHEAQTRAIQDITQSYIQMTQLAAQLNSPELVKGFLPIMKLNLNNCKVSSSIHRQIEEALDNAYKEMDKKSKMPPPPTPEEQKLKADMQLEQAKLQSDKEKAMLEQQTELKRLDIELVKVQGEHQFKQEEIAIKKQEADRKDRELDAQMYLEQEKLNMDADAEINIAGDVADLV